jgi:NADH-quinone oxidoreductase subunit M
VVTLIATIGVILSACYMLWSVQRILFNRLDKPENRHLSDVNFREASMLLPLCGLIIWMGLYPAPFLRRMEPSLTRLVEQVERGSALRTAATPPAAVP